MDLLLRFAIALLALGSAAATFLSVAVCSFYVKRPPQGERAMGLIIPVVLLGGAGVALVVATWCTFGRGSLEALAPHTGLRALFATAIGIGLGGGAFAAFVAWAERRQSQEHATLLLFPGLLAPIAGAGLLVALSLEPNPRPEWADAASLALAAVALPGLLLSLGLYWVFARSRHRHRVAANERAREERAARAAERAKSPAEKTRDYLALGASTPVWHLCMALFHERDATSRKMLVENLATRPDLRAGLEETLSSKYASLRGGALDFLREHEGEVPPVHAAVLRSLELLAEDIVRSKGERSRTLDAFYEEEIARTREAAARFPGLDGGMEWKKLREALQVIVEAEHRERALRALPVGT
jgi:hypothetical protein